MRLPWVRLLPRGLQVLGVNSVPVVGFFLADWSILTALALYWCENVLGSLLVGVRLALHRHWTGKRGHWETSVGSGGRRKAVRRGGFVGSFLLTSVAFSLAHGVFLAALAVMLPNGYPEVGTIEVGSLLEGVVGVGVLLVVGLVMDLFSLRGWSFAEIEGISVRMLGRVVVVHLTILFGMAALAVSGKVGALFAVFAGLKVLVDLGAVVPRAPAAAEPPAWLVRLLNRVRSGQKPDFATYWRESHRQDVEKAARKEERASDRTA